MALSHELESAGHFSMDEAFVTPLVVTQLLNLLIVPKISKIMSFLLSLSKNFNPMRLVQSNVTADIPAVVVEMTADQGEIVQSNVTADIPADMPADQEKIVQSSVTAAQVTQQAGLPVYEPDFLRLLIMYSYTLMFTMVWGLVPFTSILGNRLQKRIELSKLLSNQHRRPIPIRDCSLGEWERSFQYATSLGIIVVSGFFYYYHAGFWFYPCTGEFNSARFVPFKSVSISEDCAKVGEVDALKPYYSSSAYVISFIFLIRLCVIRFNNLFED